MKPCYGCLKVPNVPSTHSWTPDKVKNLCISGDLYIRAFHPLTIKDDPQHDQPSGSATSPMPCPSPAGTLEAKDQSRDDDEKVSQLRLHVRTVAAMISRGYVSCIDSCLTLSHD